GRVAAGGPELAGMIATANRRLARHRLRRTYPAADASRLAAELAAPSRLAEPAPVVDAAGVGFVFSGNGAQWAGMGRREFAGDATFRDSFSDLSGRCQRLGGADLVAQLHDPRLDA